MSRIPGTPMLRFILTGGGIGYVVDRTNGAGFDYPSMITVELGIDKPQEEQKQARN